MKKLLLLSLIGALLYAEELRVDTLEIKERNYQEGMIGTRTFSILCINGYKWLQYEHNTGSISQMFKINIDNGGAVPIKCKNN